MFYSFNMVAVLIVAAFFAILIYVLLRSERGGSQQGKGGMNTKTDQTDDTQPAEETRNVDDLATNSKSILAVGIPLLVIGILLFIERGYFASLFFDASTLGNMGMMEQDAQKINNIVTFAAIFGVGGLIMVSIGIYGLLSQNNDRP